MEDIMTEQLNVDSIDMVDHDNADDDEYSMEIRNDSGESFDDGISILPSEPVSISWSQIFRPKNVTVTPSNYFIFFL